MIVMDVKAHNKLFVIHYTKEHNWISVIKEEDIVIDLTMEDVYRVNYATTCHSGAQAVRRAMQ